MVGTAQFLLTPIAFVLLAIGITAPKPGAEMRIGLYRIIQHASDTRRLLQQRAHF